MKVCKKCKVERPLSELHARKRGQPELRAVCRVCSRAEARARKELDIENFNKGSVRRVIKWKRSRPIEDFLFTAVNDSSKRRNRDVQIDSKFIADLLVEQNWKCYYTGIKLEDVRDSWHPFRPSIDRLDSSKGYIPGNVVICALCINLMKNQQPAEDFAKTLAKVAGAVFGAQWSKAA